MSSKDASAPVRLTGFARISPLSPRFPARPAPGLRRVTLCKTGGMGELLDRHRQVMPNWVALYYDEPLEIVSGTGSRVTDAAGRSYLDFFCGILTNMLGYNVPEVREAVE